MVNAGYSKRSLVQKLGIKPGAKVYFGNAPVDYPRALGDLPAGAKVVTTLRGPLNFIQYFTRSEAELEERFPALKAALRPDAMLWISWPKKVAKVSTDLTEDVVRKVGCRHGLVDVKVCAVNEVWSGLKFVYRLVDRN